ncbi:hypothetical protein MMC30_009374 [Trapelia coarctata]|nr:hypothetical protein [Trapelia coarctata]
MYANERLIDPQILGRAPAPAYETERSAEADSDNDDDRAPSSVPLPDATSDESLEETSCAVATNVTPPRYPTPPPTMAEYQVFLHHGAGTGGVGVALGAPFWHFYQLEGILGGLEIRKRHIDDGVDLQRERSAAEDRELRRERVILPMSRCKKKATKNEEGPLPPGSGAASAAGQDVITAAWKCDRQQSDLEAQPAATSQPNSQKIAAESLLTRTQTAEHVSNESMETTAALKELRSHALEAGLTPDQIATAVSQLHISRQSSTSTPKHDNKRARRQ